MLMRPAGALRVLSAVVPTAAALIMLTLAAASAATTPTDLSSAYRTAVTATSDDRGFPPVPGPTDPHGP